MARKAALLLAAIALAGFAAPTGAIGAPSVTIFPGVLSATGSRLLMTSTNAKTQTSLGNITCSSMSMTLTLTENTGTSVKGTGLGAGESFICNMGKPATVTDITMTSLTSTVANSGNVTITFKADLVGGIECHFSSASAPFTYTSGTNIVKFTNADLVGTPAACEPGFLSGEFAITSAGTSVILD